MRGLHVMDRRFNNPRTAVVRKSGCGCAAPRVRASRTVREDAAPHIPEGVEPVPTHGTKGAKCRPFLRVEKDPEKFAACNALAEQIGPLDEPSKAARLIMDAIGDEVNEVFGVMTLDIHSRMKSIAETGRGEADSVMAPMVPTLQAALIDGAHAVIIFHVHPSGIEAEPSDADIETTEAFVEAFNTVAIKFLDHVIIGGDTKNRSYYSFAEDNAL
jgi:hypothetical protein